MASKNNECPSFLSRVLAPVSLQEVSKVFFCKESLLITGEEMKFAFLPARSDLDLLIHRAESDRAVFKGLRQARIVPRDAEDMFSAGATICLTGLEVAHDAFDRLRSDAQRDLHFSGDITVRAYWSPTGGGFDVHYDPRVATTLQITARKKWWYAAAPAHVFPLGNPSYPLDAALAEVLERSEIKSCVLTAGDVLCLPPGVLHWACAETESLAFNLAFDYLGGTAAEIIASTLRYRLLESSELRAPLFRDEDVTPLQRLRTGCLLACEILGRLADDPIALRAMWDHCIDA